MFVSENSNSRLDHVNAVQSREPKVDGGVTRVYTVCAMVYSTRENTGEQKVEGEDTGARAWWSRGSEASSPC